MLYFENDYCEGAHPAILQKLTETNFEKVSGYGTDPYCASAKAKICAACGCPDADVTFISGGTQTNAIVIASMLQRWQGVLAAATGHVAAHEAGAIEYTSHKVIPLPAHEGKVSAADVRDWCATFYADANHDHMVFPCMVYISHPTEYVTLYTKAELEALPLSPSGTYLVASRPAVMGKQGTRNVVLQPESWYAVQDCTVYPLEDADLVRLLDNADVTLEVFNSAPLYAKAMAAGGWGSSIVWDGKLAAYLLDASASKYQISELTASYRAAAAFTCADYPDAGRLADLFSKMKAEIPACGEDALYNEIEFPLAQVLADMTRTGVLVDKDGIEQFGVKLRTELEQVLTRIHMETGSASFNPNSPKQLGEMLFDTMGLPHGKKTKNGWSTDAETLEKLRDIPLVEDILQYRACQKLNSTYVEGLLKVIGEDGRIHSTFNQTEARTGRLSSDNPNLQNIPIRTELGSQLRAYFVAKPGCVLVDADYSQIELRILAHITGDEHMQQAFLNGEDIHRSTAAKIYGIPQEEVTSRLRSSAKAINFGIMYGKGAYSLAKDIGVTVKEADAFLKNYLAAFPKVSGYMDKTIADAKAVGYVSTLFGRRRALPELSSSNFNVRSSGERMARNTPIQGTAADVIKLAMVRVWRRLRDEKMESRLILTVHDELIVEAPQAEADKAAQILREEMEGCVQYAVPLSTDVHAGKNWLEAH